MSPDKLVTLIVLGGSMLLLLFEWLPVGLVGILAPLSLVLYARVFHPDDMGVLLSPEEMRFALGHASVVAVAAMFVVSAGLSRTGALSFLGDGLSHLARRGRRRIVIVMMMGVAVMSAFINNTTVVLVCLPVVLGMCERLGHPPSRYLIPLSFASIFGGMMTLVGTSTNVVVATEGARYTAADAQPFAPGMWDFTPMGFLFTVVGVLYMATVGIRLLPDRVALSLTLSRGNLTEYVTEAELPDGSTLVGKSLEEAAARYSGVRILQLIRNGVIEIPAPKMILQTGDVLLVKGEASRIIDLTSGAVLRGGLDEGDVKARKVGMTLAEVIVPPRSRWIDKRVSQIGFRSRYGVSVIAVQRHGHHIRQSVGNLKVEPADMLLVQGTAESLRNLRASENLILIEGVETHVTLKSRAPLALAVLALFVSLVSTSVLDLSLAGIVAATAMVLCGCITLQEAVNSVDWNVLFLLAGFLALGTAMFNTGLGGDIAQGLVHIVGDLPSWALVGVIYLACAFLSDLMTNVAVAALMVPVVVEVSRLRDMPASPLLMTVAFAASAAFLTPMGYQTNLLVFAPGGYRFSDYMRVGVPLRFLFILLAMVFIPWIYGI